MLKKLLNLSYGLITAAALCATSQAGVVFTDTFDHPGAITDFQAAGWTNIVTGSGLGTESYMGGAGQTVPESCMWGNGCSLEFHATNLVSCGDIITINANCMRFEGYGYLREIVLWDGVNDASRVSVAILTDGHAVGPYATWWSPPVKDALATVTYTATPVDAGKHLIFRYGHQSGWGDTADVTFSVASVTAPTVTQQPTPVTRTVGETAILTVGATGCGLTYKWTKNGGATAVGTDAALTFSSVALADAGDYACAVSNSYGGFVSSTAHLTVDPKLGGGASLAAGVNFSGNYSGYTMAPTVTATAYGVPASRWFTTPDNANNAGTTYGFGPDTFGVSWTCANTWSVGYLPSDLVPGNEQVNDSYLDDGGVGYSVIVSGLTTTLGYKEYVVKTIASSDNATAFAAAILTDTTTTVAQNLTYGATAPAVAGYGLAAVSGSSTTLTNDSIILTSSTRSGTTRGTLAGFIATDKPVIVVQPSGPTNAIFVDAGSFTLGGADVFGVSPLTYQWQMNGTNIPGATTASYAKTGLSTNDTGVYALTVSNSYGAAVSVSLNITVVSFIQPTILQQPTPFTGYVGHTAGFTCLGYGGGLSYQWYKGSAPVTGNPSATTTALLFTGLAAGDAGDYTCVVTNPMGSVTSVVAHLTVLATPPTSGYVGAVLGDNPVSW